jgi:hypothetical protein
VTRFSMATDGPSTRLQRHTTRRQRQVPLTCAA